MPTACRSIRLESGLHWVGDLMLEANVKIESANGELLLDLVEAGNHFTCRIDLATGEAKLSAENAPDFAPKAKTSLTGTGKHRVAFSNFDDQLLLWVDGKVVDFEAARRTMPTASLAIAKTFDLKRATKTWAILRRPASARAEQSLS